MSSNSARRAFGAFRKVLFWCHLAAGTAAGLVVLLMSVTGVTLAYQRQTLEWIASRHAVADSSEARVPLDSLAALARTEAGGRKVAGLIVRADPRMPVSVTLEDRTSLFFDPSTGALLGTDAGPRGFFAAVERIHRSIAYQGTKRWDTGTAITGAANLAFLFLILSGLVLWWPRIWSRQAFRRVLVFTQEARGKARDWNWHHVLGVWAAPILVLIVVSAAFISYDWPQRLVERAFGQEPVSAPAAGRAEPGPATRLREPSLDTVWSRVMEGAGSWHSVQVRLSPARQASATISHTPVFRPDERTSVTLGPDGEVTERRGYDELDPARRFRAWMRPLHTGEVAGIPGQTLAALVSAMAAVLVYTGLALAWRRMRTALRRRDRAGEEALEEVLQDAG